MQIHNSGNYPDENGYPNGPQFEIYFGSTIGEHYYDWGWDPSFQPGVYDWDIQTNSDIVDETVWVWLDKFSIDSALSPFYDIEDEISLYMQAGGEMFISSCASNCRHDGPNGPGWARPNSHVDEHEVPEGNYWVHGVTDPWIRLRVNHDTSFYSENPDGSNPYPTRTYFTDTTIMEVGCTSEICAQGGCCWGVGEEGQPHYQEEDYVNAPGNGAPFYLNGDWETWGNHNMLVSLSCDADS